MESKVFGLTAQRLGVRLVMLFGSRAKGNNRPSSDYDVAYWVSRPLSLAEEGALAVAVAAELGTNEDAIDLINLDVASPLLQHEAAAHGKPLYYNSPRDVVDFALLAWKRYQHTAKFRRLGERVLAKKYGT